MPTQDEEKLLFLCEQCDVPIKGRDTKQTILKPLVDEDWTKWEQKRALRDSVLGWVVDIIRVAVEEGMEKNFCSLGNWWRNLAKSMRRGMSTEGQQS